MDSMGTPKLLTFGITVILLITLELDHFSSVSAQMKALYFMDEGELTGLQKLWGAWNFSTPALESNLAGWRSVNASNAALFGFGDEDNPCFSVQKWRGLLCTKEDVDPADLNATQRGNRSMTSFYFKSRVTGLILNDVSITGQFPNVFIQRSLYPYMSILMVTKNPNLIGPFPSLHYNGIRILDLHGNGFSGQFPFRFLESMVLEYIDLSNNNFSGEFTPQSRPAFQLRTLLLSNNNFSGGIDNSYNNWITPSYANFSTLAIVDFSNNRFSGPFCNISKAIYLITLNISNNLLSGEISPSMLNTSGMPELKSLDLSNNKFNGSMPNLSSLTALEKLDLSWNDFSHGLFPNWIKYLNAIQYLALSGTNLTGTFDDFFLKNLTSLKVLLLDNNTFSGVFDISTFYNNIKATNKSLQLLSLQNNYITHVTFNSSSITNLGNSITFNLHGNPYCNNSIITDLQRCVCDGYCIDSNQDIASKSITKVIIISSITSGSIVMIVILMALFFVLKNRREKRYFLLTLNKKFAEYELKPTLFTFSELQKATQNFHIDLKLGQGGYGIVYKGQLLDGSNIAVKQLFTPTQQNMDEFLNEVVLLSSVKHRNLVKLKGCCVRGNQRLLVYEYMEKYDLGDVLFDKKGNQRLNWPSRMNICLGVAQGLHYLHFLVEPKIIHRDIKANNILLDKNFQAKIADFGLALLFPDKDTHIMTLHVAGTRGYLAPEYATLGILSDKIDVFSFGVLVLEVVSGRRNIDLNYASLNKAYLVEWAWKCCSESTLLDLVDPTLALHSDEEMQVQKVINVALMCLHSQAEKRPSMVHVVAMLQGNMDIDLAEIIPDSSALSFEISRDFGIHYTENNNENAPLNSNSRYMSSIASSSIIHSLSNTNII